jgi:putative integral membrane protein (TIGR02587 family)
MMARDSGRSERDYERGSWRDEIQDLLRAASGGFIFAVPLLYTMEMWEIGVTAELWKLLLFLGVALALNLGLAHSHGGGFKAETNWFSTIEQAVDTLAVGLVGGTVVLLVLNQIAFDDPPESILGRVMAQAVPLSIGAAVAAAIFGPRGERSRDGNEEDPEEGGDAPSAWQAFLSDIGATCLGAIFLAFSIAPTDEVSVLAVQLTPPHQVAVIILSLLLSYMIVFVSGFSASSRNQPGPFQLPITETALAYSLALLVSFGALLLFDRVELSDPPAHILTLVIVLGLPATVGGAAGRLVV